MVLREGIANRVKPLAGICSLAIRHKYAWSLFYGPKQLKAKHFGPRHLNVLLYHCSEEFNEELPSSEWYKTAFPKLNKLSHVLRNVDSIDGRLVYVENGLDIMDDNIRRQMHTFKSLSRAFLGSPSVQEALKMKAVTSPAATRMIPDTCFGSVNEREPMILNTLTKVCNFLNISAQQRKSVRLTICPQVTLQRIWTGALEEILKGLKSEMESLNYGILTRDVQMAEQIVSSCLKFLADSTTSSDPDSISWMRLTPSKKIDSPPPSRRWGDALEMLNDLMKCFRNEKEILYHVSKVEAMKEGMYQIKDVLVDKDLGYKEARHQESLVQKKLTKTLGHSSQCLFTLLQYYLYGNIRDIEIEVCGGLYKGSVKGSFCVCIGKILTSDEEKMVRSGIKQLDRALGLFRFVWETAGIKEVLELQGHLWCVGAEDRTLTYRGNVFFLHGIRI
ncbi:PREDICTED: uncharacterized protein LOC104595348 [Nelumbo nucifera]|uniref:Uncharacterized protein n=2 Tax=Nelumbo nucifera TaxID=4432 RepID=A0A822Y7E1_NELNU|nr:PREDICTED: uncharacterized protein LOC104595348 [Nelumbo nucifera]DAD27106.1 TPA_asm: hypothetical protein HUJ06_028574 [Nelumbo nucifera]